MKTQFYIPKGTTVTLDEIGRVTLMFRKQEDAVKFMDFLIQVTSVSSGTTKLTMERVQ